MSNNEDTDKTEDATPFKLKEAHDRGQVAKSMEVNNTISLLVFVSALLAFSDTIGRTFAEQIRRLIIGASQVALDTSMVQPFMTDIFNQVFLVFSPIVIALLVFGIAVTLLQTKPVLSFHPVKPDFNRLNPAKGLKRLFSMKVLFELAKTLIKLVFVGALTAIGIKALLPDLLKMMENQPDQIWQDILSMFSIVGYSMLALFIPIAVIDFIFVRWDFLKSMRMSKREIKDEYKRREGHPELKQKRKELQRALSEQAQSMGQVKNADIIITNPVHFAVALQYKPKEMVAPIIITKGAGNNAQRIKELARKHGVPILRKPATARLLYKKCDIDTPVPESAYEDIAPVFRWLLAARKETWHDG